MKEAQFCQKCDREITFFTREPNCPKCGLIYCSRCAAGWFRHRCPDCEAEKKEQRRLHQLRKLTYRCLSCGWISSGFRWEENNGCARCKSDRYIVQK